MADIALASDRSYEVFQLRRLKGELGPQSFDNTHLRLHDVSGYRQFIADADDTGDRAHPNPREAAAILGGDESDTF
jgi:hypothetical protein